MANPGLNAPTPPRKARSGCLTAFMIVALIFVVGATMAGAGAWYLWNQRSGDSVVGRCFPAATDGPLDSSHGTVSCSHPKAIWQITKVMDGRRSGDVLSFCGPDGDALVYVDVENKSYCIDHIN